MPMMNFIIIIAAISWLPPLIHNLGFLKVMHTFFGLAIFS